MDLVVAISSTAVRAEENFEKTKDVIKSVVEEFGRERIHYGILLFGKQPIIKVRLGDYFDTDEQLKTIINSLRRETGPADSAKVRVCYKPLTKYV